MGWEIDVRPVRRRVKSQSYEREMTEVRSGDEGWRRADLFPSPQSSPKPIPLPSLALRVRLSRGRERERKRAGTRGVDQRKNFFARSKKLLRIGVFSSPQRAANSSSFCRCSPFRCVGTSTNRRASRSPRSRPLTLMISFAAQLENLAALRSRRHFQMSALPSRVGTAISPPSAATVKAIGTSQ